MTVAERIAARYGVVWASDINELLALGEPRVLMGDALTEAHIELLRAHGVTEIRQYAGLPGYTEKRVRANRGY